MKQKKPEAGAAAGRPLLDEADIGSGEKTPAQHETDDLIRQIPPLPPSGSAGATDPNKGGEQAGKPGPASPPGR